MEQNDAAVAGTARGLHRLRDLRHTGHAGGDDQWLAGRCRALDQRNVHDLERGDLVGWRTQAFQKVDGGRIEGTREQGDAPRARMREQMRVPIPWRMRLTIQIIERATVPQATLDAELRSIVVDGDRVGGVGLDLDRVGAGLLRRVDDGQGALKLPQMVGGHLRDDVRRLAGADLAAGDGDVGDHGCLNGVGSRTRRHP